MAELAPGVEAPDFTLPRDGGSSISLSEFRGRPVVLFFYPKDDTQACTVEAKDFTAAKPDFDAAGVELIGLSPDPVKKHDKFVKKHELGVALASDESLSNSGSLWRLEGKEHVWPHLYGRRAHDHSH